jgi:hypothetical protein
VRFYIPNTFLRSRFRSNKSSFGTRVIAPRLNCNVLFPEPLLPLLNPVLPPIYIIYVYTTANKR